jgi:hypothetical protein
VRSFPPEGRAFPIALAKNLFVFCLMEVLNRMGTTRAASQTVLIVEVHVIGAFGAIGFVAGLAMMAKRS